MLMISDFFGIFEEVGRMLRGIGFYSKELWSDIIWRKAWEIENQDWNIRTNLCRTTEYRSATVESVKSLIW